MLFLLIVYCVDDIVLSKFMLDLRTEVLGSGNWGYICIEVLYLFSGSIDILASPL